MGVIAKEAEHVDTCLDGVWAVEEGVVEGVGLSVWVGDEWVCGL
jgi:hypothetical protein